MKPADVAWPLRERNSLEISTRVEGTKHVQVGRNESLGQLVAGSSVPWLPAHQCLGVRRTQPCTWMALTLSAASCGAQPSQEDGFDRLTP